MHMKKTLVTLIAACTATSAGTALAEVGPFNIYGQVEARTVDRDDTDLDSFLDAARLGVKQSVQLDKFDDLQVRYQIEFDLPTNSTGTDSRDVDEVGVRKAQINLIGNFGEVIIGRQNHLMAQAKKIDQFKNDSGAFVMGPDRIGNALSYVTPSFGPVNGFVQVISDVNADQTTATDDADATTLGLSVVGEMYDVQASYYDVSEDFDTDKVELASVGGSVSLDNLGLFATYQSEDFSNVDMFGIGASYQLNDTTLKIGYSATDNDNFNGVLKEGSYVQLLADYDLGEGVSAFAQYIEYDTDAETTLDKGDALSVGIKYVFGTEI
ncbi:MAG: porin [Motiliproteus sp.]